MLKRLTVIGGGSTGHGVAGVMAMRGFEVTLHDDQRFADRFETIRQLGGIQLRGMVRGMGMPAKITTDPAEAVKGAQAIFIHVMSDRHEEIARRIAPHLEDGQHIVIFPGNLGSFIFRRVFEEMGVAARVTVSEKEGNFFPCRLSGAAEVTVGLPLNLKGKIAALPSSDTEAVIKALEGVVEYTANQNVFEGAINAGNVINHIASTILSSSAIQHQGNEFSLFKYAFTPAAVNCTTKIRQERLAVMEAMGMPEHGNPMGMIEKVNNPEKHPENEVFRNHMDGPNALDHRYLHEDCGCGCAFAVSVGKRCGVETPVLAAFVTVAGAINDRDYLADGRTLENLGFPQGMTMEEIYRQI